MNTFEIDLDHILKFIGHLVNSELAAELEIILGVRRPEKKSERKFCDTPKAINYVRAIFL